MDTPLVKQDQRILGGAESQVVIGAGLYTVTRGLYCYAVTCRITGTIIAAINVRPKSGDNVVPYIPTWLGIILYQGETFISYFPIVSIQLTGQNDAVKLHCDKPF